MRSFFTLISCIIISLSLNASEVDSFTNRYQSLQNLEDVTKLFNQYSNQLLDQAIEKTNRRNSNCDQKKLENRVQRFFGQHLRSLGGKLYHWLMSEGPFERRIIAAKDSIYRDFKPTESISLSMVSRLKDTMGVQFKMGDLIIGSDKYAHFFNRGFKYYKSYYRDGKTLSETIAEGTHSEVSLFGSKSTGVSSFGDLAANFQGMRFYNDLVGLKPDVVTGEMPKPYVKCIDNKWVKVRSLIWNEYVDYAWDEGHNCSMFRNTDLATKVEKRVAELEENDSLGRRHVCPIDLNKLRSTKSEYGKFYDDVINEKGHISIPR